MNPPGSGIGYLILAYAISVTLLWGYAVLSWIDFGRLQRRRRRQDSTEDRRGARDPERGILQ